MSCEDIRQQFLDRDWDQAALDQAVAMVEHLKQCRECRIALDQYDELRRLLRMDEIPPEVADVPDLSIPRPRARRVRPGVVWVVAASLIVGISGWVCYFRGAGGGGPVAQRGIPPGPDQHTPQPVPLAVVPAIQFTRADIDREVQVFRNVSEMFDGRTSWVALADQSADMGLMPMPAVPQRKVLLLRLVMSRGMEPRSNIDLVIVPGEEASLEVPFQAGQVLHYQIATTAGKDQRLSLWAEVRTPNDGETLAALATSLRPLPGQVLSAGRLVTASGGYNLEIASQEKTLTGAKP